MSLSVNEFVALGGLIFTIGVAILTLLIRAEGRLKRVETIVERELTPNGGASIRDRIVRIETQLHSLNLNTE